MVALGIASGFHSITCLTGREIQSPSVWRERMRNLGTVMYVYFPA